MWVVTKTRNGTESNEDLKYSNTEQWLETKF